MCMANVRFICCSDTHGTVPPAALESDCEAWLHAGDFHNKLQNRKDPYKTNKIPPMRDWLKQRTIPLYMVKGNHDVADPTGLFSGVDISGSIQKLPCGINLIGIGWSGGEFYDLPRERDIAEQVQQIARLCVAKINDGEHTIIMTHYPAHAMWTMNGSVEGWMFDSIRMLIDSLKPLAVVQGHIHELFGKHAVYKGSLLFFPGPTGHYLDLDTEKATAILTPI